MAALSLTYSLSNGTTADAAQVQQDLTDIVNYVNNSVVRTDGTNAMAAALSLSGNPTSAAHAVRKAYMDGAYVYANNSGSTTYTSATTQVIKYGTVTKDIDNGSSSSNYSSATGLFTVPRTGIYEVAFAVDPVLSDIHSYRLILVVNGVSAATLNGPANTPSGAVSSGATQATLSMAASVYATAGDTIQPSLKVYSGNVTAAMTGWLTIAWLHG